MGLVRVDVSMRGSVAAFVRFASARKSSPGKAAASLVEVLGSRGSALAGDARASAEAAEARTASRRKDVFDTN
jgi:hypothetical protein